MDDQIIVELSRPIRVPGGSVSRLAFRHPGFDDYMELGEPYVVADTPDGNRFVVEDFPTIKRYIERCLVEPKDPALLRQVRALEAREIRIKFMGFFREREPGAEVSETSPTSSPSPDTGPTASPTSVG